MSYLLIKVIHPDHSDQKDKNTNKKNGNIFRIGFLGLIVGMLLNVRPNAIILATIIILLVLSTAETILSSWRKKLFWHLTKALI
jgi:hypothetical protein